MHEVFEASSSYVCIVVDREQSLWTHSCRRHVHLSMIAEGMSLPRSALVIFVFGCATQMQMIFVSRIRVWPIHIKFELLTTVVMHMSLIILLSRMDSLAIILDMEIISHLPYRLTWGIEVPSNCRQVKVWGGWSRGVVDSFYMHAPCLFVNADLSSPKSVLIVL